jgi:hypothetical protein
MRFAVPFACESYRRRRKHMRKIGCNKGIVSVVKAPPLPSVPHSRLEFWSIIMIFKGVSAFNVALKNCA